MLVFIARMFAHPIYDGMIFGTVGMERVIIGTGNEREIKRMRTITISFLLTYFVSLFVAKALLTRVDTSLPGFTSIRLVRGCEVWVFDERLQPEDTVVLACPRMDGVRLWPLPVMSPWAEDGWEWWEGPGEIY